jgi:ABC-type antimicrobial peptide transport system permease subunit
MSETTIIALILGICLGLGLLAAIIGIFFFNGFHWWDKF